ncbi:MAG: mandelate racemase/muconate lactonizing enzyme family protein [Thermoleophilia bacterium]|nr:mandelate racemase/muconate lactonizing enzyme family protein [Thermoleophilia bacterium]
MRISELRVTVVSVPFTESETWIWGRRGGITNALVELVTDEGVTGIGECPGHPNIGLVCQVLESVRDVVVGEDALRPERLVGLLLARRGLHHFRHAANTALGGVEIALWDIVGKVAGKPLSRLLGGPVRDRVSYYRYVPMGPSEWMAEQAAEAVADGVQTIYLKTGFERRKDVADVAAVREAVGPAVKLRIDANEAWSPAEAISIVNELEAFELEFVEQPVSMYDLDGLARVRRATTTPIAANQAAWLESNVLEIVRKRAADVILTCPHQLHGLVAFKHVAGLCELAGLPIVKHSFGDLGVTTYAAAHVLGTVPNATLASQTHYNLLDDDVIVGGPPPFVAGSLTLPDAPGIGVELDRDRVATYAELYERDGEFSVYGPLAERPVS